jgi:hypothetical protein
MGWNPDRFEHEMKKFDSLLRLRLANDGRSYVIERKAAHGSPCTVKPRDNQRIDDYICNRDGYVHVARVQRDHLNHESLLELRAHDMWTYRGAGYYADVLDAQEAAEDRREAQERSNVTQALASEAYDRIAIMERRRASNFRSKVGGWEPK